MAPFFYFRKLDSKFISRAETSEEEGFRYKITSNNIFLNTNKKNFKEEFLKKIEKKKWYSVMYSL